MRIMTEVLEVVAEGIRRAWQLVNPWQAMSGGLTETVICPRIGKMLACSGDLL